MEMLKLSHNLTASTQYDFFIQEASLKSPRCEGYKKYEKRNYLRNEELKAFRKLGI
jgi:hypothetical protein